MNRKKLFLKTFNESYKKKKHSNIFSLKKDIETVQKLNMQNYPSPENTKNESISRNKKRNNSLLTNEDREKLKKQTDDCFNTLAISIRKLKTYYPNIKDEVFNENYTNGQIPSRTEHINLEEKLKLKIKMLTLKENELKKNQENLEKCIDNLENLINDKQLNIEAINNIDNNTSKLEKIFTEKYINDINKNLKSPAKEKNKNINYTNSKEFQEQLNLFLLREEYNSNQKIKEIKESIINDKNIKIQKIDELNKVNDNLKIIHENKKKEIEELYMHYLNILKEGKDTRNEGLSWIIREIFHLDKKVIISFFPKFLDKLCIHYLFNITHINMEITETEKQIKICKKDFKDKGIVKDIEKNENDEFLTQRNNAAKEDLKKIRRQFSHNINKNNRNNKKNIKNNTFSQESKKKEQNQIVSTNLNNISSIKKSILKIHENNDNKKDENNLPYINGDPNNVMDGKNQDVSYTNKLLKDEMITSIKIPPIIRVKDFNKMFFTKNYFTSNDIIKVKNFFGLRRKLNMLREEKDFLKTNEMDRIFKEFQRNNYEKRYNVDKIRVISALIGEDNIKNEIFRQEKREKLYNDQISKSQLHSNNRAYYRTFSDKKK